MIAAGGLDAVVIVVPDDLHPAIAEAAAEAGLHVFCEKPLANSLAAAEAMAAAVRAARVVNMVLFTWRWQPHWRYVRHLLDTGYVGRVLRARLSFFEGISFGPGYKWRFDGRRGSGTAGDLGSHMIDMAHWLTGKDVTSVSADFRTFADQSGTADPPPLPANDSCFIALRMAGGAQVMVDVSSASYMADRDCLVTLEIHGDQGTIEGSHRFLGAEVGVTLKGARVRRARFLETCRAGRVLRGWRRTRRDLRPLRQAIGRRPCLHRRDPRRPAGLAGLHRRRPGAAGARGGEGLGGGGPTGGGGAAVVVRFRHLLPIAATTEQMSES